MKSGLFFFYILCFAVPVKPTVAEDAAKTYPVRGVWLHPAFFGSDQSVALEKIRTTLDDYRRAGINSLFILVKNTTGHIYYAGDLGVTDPAWNWDFLAAFLVEAGKRDMQVHAWFCVFHESAMLGQVRLHPEWLVVNPKREMVGVVNPALPAVREYEMNLMLELVKKYPVNWIHLDYVRYPCEPVEPYFSFDPATLKLFKQDTGIDLAAVKNRDSGSMAWNEWLRWNREQVTLFVRELGRAVKSMDRKIKISAAVFPDAATAKVMIGQDWASWARDELVDMLNPMLYTDRVDLFEKFVHQAMEIVNGHTLVCPGIGVGSGTWYNWSTPESMVEQMEICRSLKTDGVVYFSAYSLDRSYLDKLTIFK